MMSVLICPVCGAESQPDAETCRVCASSLAGVDPTPEAHPQDADHGEMELLPRAQDDLPDLLRSLRQDDEDLSDLSTPGDGDLPGSPEGIEETQFQEDIEPEPDVPEWLDRIRQRAQTEADAAGEITQKIIAAQASLDDEKKEDQLRQFESLIQKIHVEDDEQSPKDEPVDEASPDQSSAEGDSDWLAKIRKKHRPTQTAVPPEQVSDREGDSLLQWLVTLEDGEALAEEGDEAKGSSLSKKPDDTQEVELSASARESTQEIILSETKSTRRRDQNLSISREEQARADQLSATIIDEKATRPIREPVKDFAPRWLRLAIGVLLIAVLSLALFFNPPADLPTGMQGEHSLGMIAWLENLPADASLLFVLDYQAGYSAEMRIIAQPILDQVFQDARQVSILSATPAGSLLFNRLLENADLVDRLTIRDLGYYPSGPFSAFGLASQVNPTWQFRSQPDLLKALTAQPFDSILILADDYEGAVAWIEQFSSLAADTPIVLLVSAQAGPLLLPYWESGQVVGVVSGISDVVNIAGEAATFANRWRAYQVGIVLMMIMLIMAVSFPDRKQPGEGGMVS